jgi:predicted dehydrogenase
MKPLRIGLIGYGFMGRTHSNAFTQVNNFFDLEYRPVLKAICARDAGNAKAFAAKWRYESIEPRPTMSTLKSPSPPPRPVK